MRGTLIVSALCAAALALSGCSSLGGGYGYGSEYSLVRPQRVRVGNGSLSVEPPRAWNRHRSCSKTSGRSRTGPLTAPCSTA